MNSHHQHQLSRRLAQEVVGSDFLIISWIHFYSKIFKIFKICWVTENRSFLILTTCIKAWKFDDYLHFMLKVGSVDECSSLIVVFETLRSSWSCDCHWSDHHVHWLRGVSVWITNLDREGQDEYQSFFLSFQIWLTKLTGIYLNFSVCLWRRKSNLYWTAGSMSKQKFWQC